MTVKTIQINENEITMRISKKKLNPGLYIVATPIGNLEDITIRSITVMERADLIICEDRKTGSRILKNYNIVKKIEILNEHNEQTKTKELFDRISREKIAVALISDCGTPLFEDPGNQLVDLCLKNNQNIYAVPGASSLTASLMVSGLSNKNFFYYGFLPANKKQRIRSLKSLGILNNFDLIFLDTPYRMKQIIDDMASVLGKKRQGIIFYRLTFENEKIYWGTLDELNIQVSGLPKGEFVLILKKQKMRK